MGASTQQTAGHEELLWVWGTAGRYILYSNFHTVCIPIETSQRMLWKYTCYFMDFLFVGHSHWVLCVVWSPDGKKLASGCKNGDVRSRLLIGD